MCDRRDGWAFGPGRYHSKDYIETDTLAYSSSTGIVRNIRAHRRATR